MRTIIVALILILIIPYVFLHAQDNGSEDTADRGDIIVEIRGLRNSKGSIRATLFNTPKGFPNNPKLAFKTASVPITEDNVIISFGQIPFGIYAVGVFHDENSNKKMDANFWGAPKEGYGASNDARGILSPPSFDDAKFILDREKLNITLLMVYRD